MAITTIVPASSAASAEPAKLLHRICPLLEQAGPTRILPFAPEPWVLRECLQTGLVYLENPPEYAAFEEEFAWEVTKAKEAERRATVEPLFYSFRVWWKGFRTKIRCPNHKVYELAAACIRSLPERPVSLVDLGCGEGDTLLNTLARLPADVVRRCIPQGVEISKVLAHRADQILQSLGGSCLQQDALSGICLFPDSSVDLIVIANFLEHEINPLPLLRACRQKLTAEGKVVIKVPNYDSLGRQFRGHRWCGFRWPDHVNYFTPCTLQLTIEAAGLRIARMRWIDSQPANDNMYAVVERA